MTALETPVGSFNSDAFSHAREALSGKRIALIGFEAAANLELTRVITAAEGFTRSLSPHEVCPSDDILKPFELILLDIESAAGTSWLEAAEVASVSDRCIAVGQCPVLLRLLAKTSLAFREFRAYSGPPEDLLVGCVLALRAGSRSMARTAPASSTVVLADDDPSVTALVRRALERNGMTCQIAASGGDALALITKLKPCAVVLDVHMPHIDGFEVLSRIKATADLAQTRVILLTGCEQESDIIRGFSLGADDYVVKPFNPMELTIRLMRVIGRI